MRSLDLIHPDQRYMIAKLFLDRAIASLPATATREQQIKEAIRIGKTFQLRESDFEEIS